MLKKNLMIASVEEMHDVHYKVWQKTTVYHNLIPFAFHSILH